jgi:post-segregation antitoxin (ccd killing protein)
LIISPTVLAARDELQQVLDAACEMAAEQDHQADGANGPLHQLCLAARNLASRLQVYELRAGDVSDRTIADGIAAAVRARAAARQWQAESFQQIPTINNNTGELHG